MSTIRTRMSRQRILDGAWRILDSGEASDLTVDAIARALHMSKSTLYKYFTSKEEVVVGLIDQACATTHEEVQQAARQVGARSLEESVAIVLELYAAHAERLPRAVLLEPEKLPAACGTSLDRIWRSLHEVSRSAVGGNDELAATALSTSARAALVAAAGGEVSMTRGEAARSLGDLFLTGLSTAVSA